MPQLFLANRPEPKTYPASEIYEAAAAASSDPAVFPILIVADAVLQEKKHEVVIRLSPRWALTAKLLRTMVEHFSVKCGPNLTLSLIPQDIEELARAKLNPVHAGKIFDWRKEAGPAS